MTTTNRYADLQFRIGLFSAASLYEHHLENLYHLRGVLHSNAVPRLLHL